jgi:hypothetical protein
VSNSLGTKSFSTSKITKTSLSKASIASIDDEHIFLVKDDLVLILFLDTYYIAWISIASA